MRELVRSKTGGAIIGPDRTGLQDSICASDDECVMNGGVFMPAR